MHKLACLPLLAAASGLCGCQTTPQRVRLQPRFSDPQQILLRAESGVMQLASPGPQYPDMERSRNEEAWPVVAYVVGTDGRIELGSMTFIVSISAGFANSLCEWARRARFTPARDSFGTVRRTLVTQAFAFEIGEGGPRHLPDASRESKRLVTLGSDRAFAHLETFPGC